MISPDDLLAHLDDDINSDADCRTWMDELIDDRRHGREAIVPTTALLLKGFLDGDVKAIDAALAFTLNREQMFACEDEFRQDGGDYTDSYRVCLDGLGQQLPTLDAETRELFGMAAPSETDALRYLHCAPVDLSRVLLAADRGRVAGILLPIARDHVVLRQYIFTLSHAWCQGMYNALRLLTLLPKIEPYLVAKDDFLHVRELVEWQRRSDALIEKRYQEAMAHVAAGGSLPYPPIRDDD